MSAVRVVVPARAAYSHSASLGTPVSRTGGGAGCAHGRARLGSDKGVCVNFARRRARDPGVGLGGVGLGIQSRPKPLGRLDGEGGRRRDVVAALGGSGLSQGLGEVVAPGNSTCSIRSSARAAVHRRTLLLDRIPRPRGARGSRKAAALEVVQTVPETSGTGISASSRTHNRGGRRVRQQHPRPREPSSSRTRPREHPARPRAAAGRSAGRLSTNLPPRARGPAPAASADGNGDAQGLGRCHLPGRRGAAGSGMAHSGLARRCGLCYIFINVPYTSPIRRRPYGRTRRKRDVQ